jgi:hypothetical protein
MSYSIRTKPARIAIALVLTLALIFGLTPLLPSGTASAADPALTVEFRTGATVDGTITYTAAELEALASSANTDKYLAWDGSKFVVLATNSSIPLSTLLTNKAAAPAVSNATIGNNDIVEVTDGTVTKTFGGRSVGANSYFYGDTTETTGIGSAAATATTVLSTAVLSLDTGQANVAGTADATNVSTFGVDTSLRFLTGLDNRDQVRLPRTWDQYLKEEDAIARYVSGVTKISIVRSGPLANFKVFTQIGDNGQKKLAKNFTLDELNKLANNDVRAYLQSNPTSGINWAVHATNKYVTIDKLLAESGIVFNAADILVPRADDGFQTKLDYEFIQANKFFYGGTSATGHDTGDPIEVGAVLAISWHPGTNITAETAKTTLGTIDWTGTNVRNTGRFYVGASRANYLNSDVAGSRFVQAPTELTIIKDALDTLTASNVTLAKSEYIVTGEQIKPDVIVSYGALTLKKDTDYTLSYGTNKDVGEGIVTVAGIGNFTGTAAKTFTIKAEPKITIAKIPDQTYSGKAKKPKLTVKADGKAVALGTGYTAKYSNNKNIGKATVAVTIKDGKTYKATFKINPKKTAGFKLKALKKSFKASWKKDSKATGYVVKYATDKKVSKSVKTYTAKKNSAVTKTFKSIKGKKIYYAKIRTYKTVSGVKYYSAWSKIVRIKTK